MTGRFVAVVGPSGAGKDTLIAAARSRLAGDDRVVFVRRVVSRADGGNEDHDTLDAACFPAAIAAGAFALHWGAHGLFYGIPARAVADVAAGRIVVANLSRGALDRARAVFPALTVVAVTCPTAVL
ncbi:phosphonate metabolism protein/1,5-bisphosphokinase (PRPP-forming) PhnN, partial [Oharaeibacter diazotrophicus]